MPIQVDEVNCRCLRGMETSEGTSRKTCLVLHSWGLMVGISMRSFPRTRQLHIKFLIIIKY